MANTTITPNTGAGFFTTDLRPFVASGALTLAGIASSVVLGTRLTPLVGAGLFSGIAPMSGTVITPPIATASLTGAAALLNLSITPVAASATLSGVAASLVIARFVTPLSGAVLSSTGAVQLGIMISGTTGQVSVSGVAPTRQTSSFITPTVASVTFLGVSASLVSAQKITPLSGAVLSLTGAVQLGVKITGTTGQVAASGTAPSVQTSSSFALKPVSGSLALLGAPPRVVATISFSSPYLLPLNGPPPQVTFADYLLPEVA